MRNLPSGQVFCIFGAPHDCIEAYRLFAELQVPQHAPVFHDIAASDEDGRQPEDATSPSQQACEADGQNDSWLMSLDEIYSFETAGSVSERCDEIQEPVK